MSEGTELPPGESDARERAAPGEPETHGDDASRARVAAVLDRVRAGVKQRQAELATVDAGREDRRLALVELQGLEWIEEPVPVSPRPGIGRLLVFARKAFFHLFHKWHARPVLHRQNAFNRAAVRLLRDLSAREEAAEERAAALARRVAELERRLEAVEGPSDAGSASDVSPAPAGGTGGSEGPDASPAAAPSPAGADGR